MGIGTSLGAFFETELDHHAGNQYVDNPNSTPDNNELSTNEVMPNPDEEPRAIPVANVTNTPGEIMEGLEGTKVWPQGYGSRGGPTAQMRRGANDNRDDLYNPREPNMIGSKAMDANIEDSWNRMVRGQQIVADRQTLINTQSERSLNDIEKARLNRLDKEHAKHFGNYYPD